MNEFVGRLFRCPFSFVCVHLQLRSSSTVSHTFVWTMNAPPTNNEIIPRFESFEEQLLRSSSCSLPLLRRAILSSPDQPDVDGSTAVRLPPPASDCVVALCRRVHLPDLRGVGKPPGRFGLQPAVRVLSPLLREIFGDAPRFCPRPMLRDLSRRARFSWSAVRGCSRGQSLAFSDLPQHRGGMSQGGL